MFFDKPFQETTDPTLPPAPPSTAMPLPEVEPLKLEKLVESDSEDEEEEIDIKKVLKLPYLFTTQSQLLSILRKKPFENIVR